MIKYLYTFNNNYYYRYYEGNYFFMHFDTKPDVLTEIEAELRQCNEIIRFIPGKGKMNPFSNIQKKGGHVKNIKKDESSFTDDYDSWSLSIYLSTYLSISLLSYLSLHLYSLL